MKEIIKKIIIAVVVIAVVGAVAGFALRSDEPEVTTSGTSSSDISTSGPDNSVNATTGNQAEQPSQQVQNPVTPQGTTASQNQQGTTNAYAPSQQGTQPSQQVQNPVTPQGTTSPQNQQDTTNSDVPPQQDTQPSQGQPDTDASQPTSQDPLVPQPPQQDTTNSDVPPQQVNKIEAYQQIFRSGKFIMKVNDPDLGDVTMAMNGNKMFVEASMEGITLKMLYDGDKPDADNPANGTWYIVIDKIKKYSPMPADMLGDMNVEDITKDFAKGDSNTVYTKSVETVNGEQLDCESCVDSNGNTTKYYFRGDTLVRSDSISPSGEVSTTEFREISGTVDESLFVIPSGYAKWDISWLMNAMG